MKAVRIEVKKTGHENGMALLRRFSRRAQEMNLVQSLKKSRYYERASSKKNKKDSALRRIARRGEYERLRKLGKVGEKR